MIGMLKRQPPQCVIPIQHACKVKVDGIEYPVIGYAPFYNVEVPGLYAFSAEAHVVQPFAVVGFKHLCFKFW